MNERTKKALAELREALRLRWNRLRIWFKRHVTGNVKVIRVEDADGDATDVTVEQSTEYSCPHEHLKLVYGTFWKCMDCEFAWFEIPSRIGLTSADLTGLLEAAARELRSSINYVEREGSDHEDREDREA